MLLSLICSTFTILLLFAYDIKNKFYFFLLSVIVAKPLISFNFENGVVLAITLSILLCISAFDLKKGQIPHLMTLGLLLMGITYANYNHWWYSIITFSIMSVVFYIIYRKLKFIGGGDVKLYIIFTLFFPLQYFSLFILVNILTDLIYLKVKRHFKVEGQVIKYAPILSFSFYITIILVGIGHSFL